MPRYGIALDLGTSGFRGQAIDLESGDILSTVITSRHPLPGANIIADLGREGLRVIDKVGIECSHTFEDCAACEECILACPEKALTMEKVDDKVALRLRMDRCNGTACLRCERACPRGGFRFIDLCFKGIGNPKSSPV